MRLLRHRPACLLTATALAVLVLLPSATGVLAKVPYFTIETSPAEPRANEPIVVTVRTWADAAHSVPTTSADATIDLTASLDSLLVVRRAGSSDIPIHLVEVETSRFAATITLPAGDWTLIAFPDRSGWSDPAVPAGYPDAIPLAVREAGPPVQVVLLAFGGLLALVLIASWQLRARRHRSRDIAER
jgi:hypothetical protein